MTYGEQLYESMKFFLSYLHQAYKETICCLTPRLLDKQKAASLRMHSSHVG